jgi:hypothetical protein
MSAEEMRDQVNAIQRLMEAVMKEGEHYGSLPGCKKPFLWKPGAEKLCVAFHIEPAFQIEDLSGADRYRYRVKCIGTHQVSGTKLGEGMGSCSSMEQRYKWRRASDPEFLNTPEERRRLKYIFDREKNKEYELKQVRVEPDDIENVVLKMACKRAFVAMTLNVTAASDIFAQDLEELPEHLRDEEPQGEAGAQFIKPPQPKPRAPGGSGAQAKDASGPGGGVGDGQEPLGSGLQRMLRAHLQRLKVPQEELLEKFGVTVQAIPRTGLAAVHSWLLNRSGNAGRLTFDPEKHLYRLDGALLAHVTGILQDLGDWESAPAASLLLKGQIGEAVHRAIELDLRGELDEDSLDSQIAGYFQAWKRFQREKPFEAYLTECQVVSAKFRYAGTLDIAGDMAGVDALIDIKTGNRLQPTDALQTAAYLCAAAEMAYLRASAKRFSLKLSADGAYRLEPHTGRNDLPVFLSCLSRHNWRVRHRLNEELSP